MAQYNERYVADCREFPSERQCTLTIAGRLDEVLDVATYHAVQAHGHPNTAELREQIRSTLKQESPPVRMSEAAE